MTMARLPTAFTIFNSRCTSSTNIPGTIVAGPVTNAATGVSNGLFTVTLDFGGGVFDGSARWLEIAMCTNGAGSFTNLAPRQEITRTPYTIEAVNAITANVANFVLASNIVGAISSGQLPATVVTNGASGVNISGTFTGNGTGVTNVRRFRSPRLLKPWRGDSTMVAKRMFLQAWKMWWRWQRAMISAWR